jgi:hypothetical protein
LGN